MYIYIYELLNRLVMLSDVTTIELLFTQSLSVTPSLGNHKESRHDLFNTPGHRFPPTLIKWLNEFLAIAIK